MIQTFLRGLTNGKKVSVSENLVSKKVSVSVSKIFGFEKSIGIGLEKNWYRKSIGIGFVKFCIEKSIGIGFQKIWYRKKNWYRFRKILYRKKYQYR